ncbi:TetR family transcriptional regulator [Acidovorax sp. SUPP2522]|uniref:TetR family transcriptional regulator n=1 Tax=unclassified Acidovorax TaxID=2684926 RepID=UPI00234966B0|nr:MULTISPECIES: TetR family transcriptional regulator [unclassified Acidovorax]WCM97395.1 TetR family transcriptional regulator [Acidovorax sp. GBBC 1281]GKT15517.1 TetR family transcriptional regulator [Acidovorax sp. SUPP2522]
MARRTKEDAVATRNSLLDAAEQVFYQKGVSHASLNEIAQAAGATRGAIYWHFKDKVDLFNAMMERVTLPSERANGECESNEDMAPLQRMRGVIDLVLRNLAQDQRMQRVFEIAFFRVEYVEELAGVRDRHIAACGAFREQLANDLRLAAESQKVQLPMPPQIAAIALQAIFEGLLQGWILNRANFDLPATGRASVDAYLRGLGLELPPLPDWLQDCSLRDVCPHAARAVP